MDWLSVNIGGGCIFQNGVMHANMAKPRSWRWGRCGYICGECIFWSGDLHANIFNSLIIFKKIFKTEMDTSLNKAQHKQELLHG
jgi:hypothetical protein